MSHTSRISALVRKSIVASLENELPDSPDGEIDTTPGNGTGDNLSTIVAENGKLDRPAVVSVEDAELAADVVEAENDLDAGNGAVDQLETARETLERSADLAERSLDEGGMSPQTAEAVEIAVDNVREQLGVEESPMPATESFGGSSTRYDATVASLEGIKDMAKTVGNAIVEAIKRVKAFLQRLFNKLMEFMLGLERRNKSLRASIETAKKTMRASKHASIDIGELFERINIDGKVDVNHTKNITAVIEGAKVFDAGVLAGLKETRDALAKVENGDVPTGVLIGLEREPGAPKGFTKQGTEYVTPVLPGNVQFKIVRNENPEKAEDAGTADSELKSIGAAIRRIRARIASGWKLVREENATKINSDTENTTTYALTTDQCVVVADMVDVVVAQRKAAGEMKEAKELNFTLGEKYNSLKNLDRDGQAAYSSALSKFASRISLANQASAKVITYATRAAAAYQTFALKSLRAPSQSQAPVPTK